jgi:hypothetical protein
MHQNLELKWPSPSLEHFTMYDDFTQERRREEQSGRLIVFELSFGTKNLSGDGWGYGDGPYSEISVRTS